jgi:HK97 family phage major capsid protein
MSHSTFWNHIFSLRDDSKFPIVREDGDGWRLLGRPVLFSDYVTDNDIYFGDFKKMVANLGERVQIESERNLQYNAYDYLGSALFDSDIALAEAFVKGAAAL